MARQDVLTPKQEAFVAEYIKNGQNGVQAALKAYDTTDYKTADIIARENLAKPRIKTKMEEALERAGIDDNRLAKVADEGLRATRPIIKGDKVFTVEDYAVRHRYLDTIHKLKGDYAPEKIDETKTEEHIVKVIIEENTELKDIQEGEVIDDETITTLIDDKAGSIKH